MTRTKSTPVHLSKKIKMACNSNDESKDQFNNDACEEDEKMNEDNEIPNECEDIYGDSDNEEDNSKGDEDSYDEEDEDDDDDNDDEDDNEDDNEDDDEDEDENEDEEDEEDEDEEKSHSDINFHMLYNGDGIPVSQVVLEFPHNTNRAETSSSSSSTLNIDEIRACLNRSDLQVRVKNEVSRKSC